MSDTTHATDSHALRVRGLAVAAGPQRLLEGLDLDVHAGELVALVGPSGCGKTTLLRCLVGLIDPSGGTVELHGQTGEQLGWPSLRRRMVLLDQRPVLPAGTVRENLARPFRYRIAGGGGFPEPLAAELLERLGVGSGRLGQDARSLSVGQQQRVCLVRALLVEPEVLLMDEPTSALDADSVEAVEALLSQRVRNGLAALVVTHDRAQVQRWCQRAVDLQPYLRAPADEPAKT